MTSRCIVLLVATAVCSVAGDPRSWWSGPEVTLLGSPSRNGKLLSFADPVTGALGVRDLVAGTSRFIATRPAGSHEFAYFSAFSPDASKIAYAWFNDKGFYELRIISTSGEGQPFIAYRNEEAGFVQPCAWTPDGKQVLTMLFRRDNISQITLIPAAGGAPRVLRSLNWVYPKKMDISPDGRWIVYDNFAVEGKPERTIFVLSLDGTQERRLIETPGDYLFPLWAPDGNRILFAGDNGGPQELFTLDVEEGKSIGQPRPLTGALGRIIPLGLSVSQELFYGVRTGSPDVYIDSRRIPTRFAGRNTAPAWSPDGKQLAYLSRRGTENFGEQARVIVIMDLVSGNEREIAAPLAHMERVVWSPNGLSLLISGSDGKGRAGLFTVRVEDGATTALSVEHDAPFRGFEGVWSRDGKSVYYLYGETELRQRRLTDGAEETILRTAAMQHLAINKTGDTIAVGIGGSAIRMTPLQPGIVARLLPFPDLTELAWGNELYAGRGEKLWVVPLDGTPPRQIPAAKGRLPGISPSPGGESIAFAAGREQAEIQSLQLRK